MPDVLLSLECVGDVAELLARKRREFEATQQWLAARTGLTRLTVSKAEHGSNPNIPLVNAAKLARAVDMEVIAAPAIRRPPAARFDSTRVHEALSRFTPDREAAIFEAAEQNPPLSLAAALGTEGRPLPWVKVRVMCQDVSVDADALTVWRARELIRLYRGAIAAAREPLEPALTAVTPLGVLRAADMADPLRRALTWVCQALRLGSPENESWFTANASLIWHGWPWLNRHGDLAAHDSALARLKVTGDADDYLALHLADLPMRAARWTVD
jgi:DNA-binding XRE family transcriptional regulator